MRKPVAEPVRISRRQRVAPPTGPAGSSMKSVRRRNGPFTGRRWGRVSVAVAAGIAATLAGCAKTPPALDPTMTASPVAPPSTPTATESGTPAESGTPSASGTPTSTGSATASSTPGVKATGSLTLYSEASKKLTGTCRTQSDVPTLAVADRSNDFFGSIDATVGLSARRTTVSKLTIALGEDSELVTRTLSYDAAKPAKGTSVELTGKGSTFTVKGKVTNTENGKVAGTMPVKLTITCASGSW